MTEVNFEEVEKEFNKLIEDRKYHLFRGIAYLSVHCPNCKILQTKKYGAPAHNLPPWELGISGEVTNLTSDLLSVPLPANIRKILENYRDLHINYKCKEAVDLITRIYGTLAKHIDR